MFLFFAALLVLSLAIVLTGCDEESSVLAEYEGARALTFTALTKSSSPDIAWVGGRVAAVGVNAGDSAALDETLIWLVTASENSIESPVRFGTNTDEQTILSLGGTLVDSLPHDEVFTFWVAEDEAFAAGLDKNQVDPFTLADSTVTIRYILRGRSSGDPALGVGFTLTRDQKLADEIYTLTWTPPDQQFRRIVINVASGGSIKDNVIWHVVLPDEQEDSILPPITVGTPPEGTLVVKEFEGFSVSNHVIWLQTSDWDGESYGLRTPGYAQLLIFENNFE